MENENENEKERMTFEIYHKDKYENYEAYERRSSKGLHIYDPNTMSEIIQFYTMDNGDVEPWTWEDHNYVMIWVARQEIKSKDEFLTFYNKNHPNDKASGELYLKIINYWYDKTT